MYADVYYPLSHFPLLAICYCSTVTKDSAKVLVKKWKALIEKANAGVPRSSTPSHIPSAAATSKKRPESTGSNPAASEGELHFICLVALFQSADCNISKFYDFQREP